MNQITKKEEAPVNSEQARRLRQLIADIIQCCQERQLFEAELFGLPRAELRCLLCFGQQRYLTAKNLALKLEVGKSRVSKLVEGLLKKQLIEIIADPKDGRVKLLTLTRRGRQKVGQIDEFLVGVHARVLSQVEAKQRNLVLAALEMLWSAMETVKQELRI
jgi:DNA-binding MarR family transcriptional regulator